MLGLCNFAAVVSGRLASGSWTHDVELVTEAEVGRERTAAVLGCSYGLSGPYGRAGHRPRSSRRPPSPIDASRCVRSAGGLPLGPGAILLSGSFVTLEGVTPRSGRLDAMLHANDLHSTLSALD